MPPTASSIARSTNPGRLSFILPASSLLSLLSSFPPGGSSPKSAPSMPPNGNMDPPPPSVPSHVLKNSWCDSNPPPPDDDDDDPSIPPLVAFVSSVSSRVSSRHSRGAPGHWRNFLTMRSHLRRITPFSSGAVRHEYCIRMERGGSEGQGRVPDPREWKNGEAGGCRGDDAHRGRAGHAARGVRASFGLDLSLLPLPPRRGRHLQTQLCAHESGSSGRNKSGR